MGLYCGLLCGRSVGGKADIGPDSSPGDYGSLHLPCGISVLDSLDGVCAGGKVVEHVQTIATGSDRFASGDKSQPCIGQGLTCGRVGDYTGDGNVHIVLEIDLAAYVFVACTETYLYPVLVILVAIFVIVLDHQGVALV